MELKDLKKPSWHKKSKRIGRGGKRGTYSGKGNKGQKARSGGNIAPGFEGQDTTLVSRSPKIRGFSSPKLKNIVISLDVLEKNFVSGDSVSPKTLIEKKLLKLNKKSRSKKKAVVKILGEGEITKSLKIEECLVSGTAQEAIVKAGGTVTQKKAKVQKERASKKVEK